MTSPTGRNEGRGFTPLEKVHPVRNNGHCRYPISNGVRGRGSLTGFTLIELVIVILILGVLLLVAFPDLSGVYRREGLREASREIAGTLSYAHRTAIIQGLNLRVNFDLDQGYYWLSVEESPKISPGFYKRTNTSFGRQRDLPMGIMIRDICLTRGKIDRGVAHITFSPQQGAGQVLIHLAADKGESFLTVELKRTGRIKVYEGE